MLAKTLTGAVIGVNGLLVEVPFSTGEVHLQYIDDKDAGGYPQTEGTLTENPVMYISHTCFTPDPFCNVSFSPVAIGYPTFIAPQGGSGCTGPATRSASDSIAKSIFLRSK